MHKLTDPEFLKAAAALVTALSWPLLVIVVLVLGRNKLVTLIDSLESLTLPGGIVTKFHRELNKEVQQSITEGDATKRLPTERQFEAAKRVGLLALDTDISVIRNQLSAFAFEYERIRATMGSGDERTRRMEVVAGKMRTMAIAAIPLLGEFSRSDSPGHRLAATVILQVTPDAGFIDWLAGRFGVETPFVSYHAAVALLTAARVGASENRAELLSAIRLAKQRLGAGNEATDRFQVLDSAEHELTKS